MTNTFFVDLGESWKKVYFSSYCNLQGTREKEGGKEEGRKREETGEEGGKHVGVRIKIVVQAMQDAQISLGCLLHALQGYDRICFETYFCKT